MSHPARGSAERGAGATLAGMRPWSRSWARVGDPLRVSGVRFPKGPLFRPSTRPTFSMGIDGQAKGAGHRRDAACRSYEVT